MSADVQVFGRRHDKAIHALMRGPAHFAVLHNSAAAMRPNCGTSVSKYRDVDPGFVERSNILFCSSLSYAWMKCAD